MCSYLLSLSEASMKNSLSQPNAWSNEFASRYYAAIERDTDNSKPDALIELLCELLGADAGSGSHGLPIQVPVLSLVKVVQEIRTRLAPHSLQAAPQRIHAWDVICTTVIRDSICPGTLSSTWCRRIQEVIMHDFHRPPYDGSDGLAMKIFNEAASIIDAVSDNNVIQLRRRLQGNSHDISLLHHRDEFGWSLLHHAAHNSCLDAIRYLILEGISPNCIDSQGRTALHVAASRLHTDAISLLLQSGAGNSICTVCSKGATPLEDFLRTVSVSQWHLCLSPMQLVETVFLLMKHPEMDIWRPRPCALSACLDMPIDYESSEYSLFVRLMWICDATVASVVVDRSVTSLKRYCRKQLRKQLSTDRSGNISDSTRDSMGPISETVKANIARSRTGALSEGQQSDETEIDLQFARLQVRLALVYALKKKRVRIVQMLLNSMEAVLDIFEVDTKEDCSWRPNEIDTTRSNTPHAFFFHCLELAVLTKSLRVIVVLLDIGRMHRFFSCTATSDPEKEAAVAPSCFLNLIIAQNDHLLLRLALERLGTYMDVWVTHTPCGALHIKSDTTGDIMLRKVLDMGMLDHPLFTSRLSLFCPISLSCLLNDHNALDMILSR